MPFARYLSVQYDCRFHVKTCNRLVAWTVFKLCVSLDYNRTVVSKVRFSTQGVIMSELVIPDLDANILTRLGERAALHGRTVEGEAKQILAEAVRRSTSDDWAAVDAIRQRLAASNRSFGDSVELVREDRQR